MGTDIGGWVEVREGQGSHRYWSGVIVISPLLSRHYDSFGCLFGVRNYARFAPVAAERGLPQDLSTQAKQQIMGQSFDAVYGLPHETISAALDGTNSSWISLAEIQAIDLDELALGVDERVSQYRRNEDGTLTLVSKAAWSADFGRASGVALNQILQGDLRMGPRPQWKEGQIWEDGSFVFMAERRTRRQVLGSWALLFRLMDLLGEQYGADGVRVVVWFDN